ncbi:MAG TPA: CPBP family intramembrane glutamic endopeptidase [Vicinamibacterales bacterium]|nr:CPBP family intramembrane glutamic endopeptidase [Vicinamibacterales bacterium]
MPRRSLLLFFVLTFLVSWTCFIGGAALRDASLARTVAGYLVYLIGVFAPALVAIALTYRAEGRAGVHALLSGMFRWPQQARWWIFAFSYMVVVRLTAAAVHRLAFGAWPEFGREIWLVMIPATILSTPVQSGEEVGWRGYALPGLADRFGLAPASLLLGAIWACWHLPLFFIEGVDKTGQSFPLYFLGVVALSVTLAWLYWRTNGSLLMTMLLHAAGNNMKDIVPVGTPGATNPWTFSALPIAWIVIAVYWAGALYFLVQMRSKGLAWTASS